MRVELDTDIGGIRVILSERNLKALLAKLQQGDSARTIVRRNEDGNGPLLVYVSSEPDDQHYGNREPGEMHPATEVLMRSVEP